MVMKRKQYTKEFKRQIIELKEQGKTAKEISSEYGINIYNNG
ncbi:MAG: transposase [Elusimicrobia bacterium]|nr:transposase [Elusimicrobiota bacterium]MDY6039619.1 transposase [Elusimicrobiaceae bacterium]